MRKFVLDNGLSVVTHNGDFSQSYVIMCVKAGFGYDTMPGMAHLVEHLSAGSSRYNVELIEDNGDALEANTFFKYQTYNYCVDNNFLPSLLSILKEEIFAIDYSREHFERERNTLLIEMRNTVDHPEKRTCDILYDSLLGCGSALKEVNSLGNARLEDALEFKQKYFVPNNMLLVIVGGFNSKRVHNEVRKVFGDVKPGSVVADVSVQSREKLCHAKFINSKQGYLSAGKLCSFNSGEEYVALDFAANIIHGGLWTSRLFRELQFHRGLAYAPSSDIQAVDRGRAIFSYEVNGFVPSDLKQIELVVNAQFDDLARRRFHYWEFKRCLRMLRSNLSAYDSEDYAQHLLEVELYGVPSLNEHCKILRMLTPEHVSSAAKQSLVGGYTSVLLLPKQNIADTSLNVSQEQKKRAK